MFVCSEVVFHFLRIFFLKLISSSIIYLRTSISTFVRSLLNIQKRKTNFWPERYLILGYKKGSMRPGCVVKQLGKIKPIIMGRVGFSMLSTHHEVQIRFGGLRFCNVSK